MRSIIQKKEYEVTFDKDFDQVLEMCSDSPRKGQDGTWLHQELKNALSGLHELGLAHSVEVRIGQELVGGLYGIASGKMFCGESMFARRNNMSKVALIHLCMKLVESGYEMIDCQQETSHLRSMGARLLSKSDFRKFIGRNKHQPTLIGKWH